MINAGEIEITGIVRFWATKGEKPGTFVLHDVCAGDVVGLCWTTSSVTNSTRVIPTNRRAPETFRELRSRERRRSK